MGNEASGPQQHATRPQAVIDAVRMRATARKIDVQDELEPSKSNTLASFPRNTIFDVIDEKTTLDGTTRLLIADPVWKGYINLRSPNGRLDLEPIDEENARKLLARSGAAALQGPPQRSVEAHAQLVEELQLEFFAEDVIPPDGSISWFDHELRDFFDSGGEKMPDGFVAPGAQPAAGVGALLGPKRESAKPEDTSLKADNSTTEMSETDCRDRDEGKWSRGTVVVISGVKSARELNGRSGVIILYDSEIGRYEVRLADRAVRLKPSALTLHPKQREKNERSKGDEIVFLSEDAKLAREGMYAVRMDPQFWYDQALERVFAARNEYEVLGLESVFTEDLSTIKKAYRKISLAVHPDKNTHPQADAAFRKVYGAFETLSDLQQQKRLLWELGTKDMKFTEQEEAAFARQPTEDDDDYLFQWWWEASVSEVEKAAEEAEGAQIDHFAELFISDGLGGSVDDVRWIGIARARDLFDRGLALFIDCRADHAFLSGSIPGAHNVPMEVVGYKGIVDSLGRELIHELLSKRRHCLIIVCSQIATPYSRCRAFCRYLLRAGHTTLPAARFRRLRGGIFGWKHRGGPLSAMLSYNGSVSESVAPEAKLVDEVVDNSAEVAD